MGDRLGGIYLACLIFGLGLISGCASEKRKANELSRADRARMLIEVGNGALLEGDPTGALQALTEAESVEPALPELHHSFALAYFRKHDLKRAIVSAKKAVEIKPDYSEANNTLGKLLIEAGKYSEAIPPLERAAQNSLSRESYKAWTNLGIVQYRLGDLKQAEKMMDRAVEESASSACVAYYYRGQIKSRNHDLTSAISDYERATQKVCASYGDAYLALGVAYEQKKQYNLARKSFLEVEKRFPNTKIAEQAMDRIRFLP